MNSSEVSSQIDNMNRKNIEPLPESLRRAAKAYQVFVFSVSPKQLPVRHIGVGSFVVPVKKAGERVSPPLAFDATIYVPVITETGIMRWSPSDGMDAAKDIVQIGKSSDLSKFGLFVSETNPPSEEDIAKAEQARVDYLASLVQQADDYYAVNGGVATVNINGAAVTRSNIQNEHREALAELGWDRPWARRNVQMAQCWNCGRSVLPSSAKCFHDGCGAPLKDEAAKARFMNGDEEPVRRRRASQETHAAG